VKKEKGIIKTKNGTCKKARSLFGDSSLARNGKRKGENGEEDDAAPGSSRG